MPHAADNCYDSGMRKPVVALAVACVVSGCSGWLDVGGARLACKVTHEAGTYTLLVRESGVERAIARTAPLSKEERQALAGYTCGPEGQDTPCDHAAHVKDPKTGTWTAYAYGAREGDRALLEELFRDLPVVVGSRIIGSETNPCRLGPAGFRDDTGDQKPSAFLDATFAMRLSDRTFDVPGDRLAVALEEGATLDWFRPGSMWNPDASSPRDAVSRVALTDAAKLVAWALGVLGGIATIWGWVSGLRRRARERQLEDEELSEMSARHG